MTITQGTPIFDTLTLDELEQHWEERPECEICEEVAVAKVICKHCGASQLICRPHEARLQAFMLANVPARCDHCGTTARVRELARVVDLRPPRSMWRRRSPRRPGTTRQNDPPHASPSRPNRG